MTSEVYAADWVYPVSGPAMRDGAIAVEDGRIAWLGPASRAPGPVRRLPGVITPGLVNAHTHLQYTGFAPIGRGTYRSFEHWSAVFGDFYRDVEPSSWSGAAREGARQAIAAGTTAFAEIVTDAPARGALHECGVHGVEYLEAIGERERTWREGGRAAYLSWLDEDTVTPAGVSPHAAYSLDGSVARDLVEIAVSRGLRVHSHLGESSAEAALYRHGDATVLGAHGDLRDEFELVRIGGSGHSTGAYADSVGLLVEQMHVAHAIYLDRADRDLLLARGTRIALCPRSNAVIGLDEAPVAAYLDEGHDIAVGTDSLASSPSLDLMADVKALARIARAQGYRRDDLAERLVYAATLGGAAAMGLATAGHGRLEVGGRADFAVFDVAVEDTEVADALVEQGEGSCRLTVSGGVVLHDQEGRRTARLHAAR